MRAIPKDLFAGVPKVRGVEGHLPLAHTLWSQVIEKGGIVIDATCGRGNDSLALSHMVLSSELGHESGLLYCLDIQERAIKETHDRLISTYGDAYVGRRVKFVRGSHETFPEEIIPESVSAIVYNLGYLPGSHEDGTERLTTTAESTIKSFDNALPLLKLGGILTATAYRGHPHGIIETEECMKYFSKLEQTKWRVFCHSPINTLKGAIVFSICKR